MMKVKREIYTVRWLRRRKQWHCSQYGTSQLLKTNLIKLLAEKLRRRWEVAHIPCQLRVFGKHGRIQFERTYGRDPRRHRG